MSENKKAKKDEKKKEEAEEKTADVKVDNKAGKSAEEAPTSTAQEKKEEPKIKGLEELPDDIKKKLEKKQPEAAKQSKKGKKAVKKKKKTIRRVTVGKAFVKATYNNTIVTLTDMQGNVISWASAGIAGFKGPKKSTPYAAQIIARIAVGKAREEYGLEEVSVFVRGVGTGRESAVRALNNNGLQITNIKDVTPMPHNGCRPRKSRRV